ncbi:urate hydroxylase PuuD [bacterium]|nr:urate hydroxylase PuuD [bacterium]
MEQWTIYLQMVSRWLHVVVGILWIGHLYFFNFVNSQLVKTYDADSKKKVVPELMPRALYWFRWGAAWTWLTGFILAALVYYHGKIMVPADSAYSNSTASLIAVAIMVVIFFAYDILWKTVKNEKVGAIISYVLTVALLFALSNIFTERALYIHLGAFFGTIMMMNVWMRIWPAQKKIIAGIKGTGPAPDASVATMAGLRSRHNTYMSVPLIFAMISNHYPTIYGEKNSWIFMAVVMLLGWLLVRFFYIKSASPATTDIGDQGAKA